jgi:hypothetical protein
MEYKVYMLGSEQIGKKNKGEDKTRMARITQRMRKVRKIGVGMEIQFSFGRRKRGWRLYYFRQNSMDAVRFVISYFYFVIIKKISPQSQAIGFRHHSQLSCRTSRESGLAGLRESLINAEFDKSF